MSCNMNTPPKPPNHRTDAAPARPESAADAPPIALPPGIDGRTRQARRWLALCHEFTATLAEPPTGAAAARLRALVTTTLALERLDWLQLRGDPVDDERLVALGNLQGRLLAELGLAPSGGAPASRPDPLAAWRERTGIGQ